MDCLNCRRETVSTAWGNWCDPCGGVFVESVPNFVNGIIVSRNPPRLFFRHVATAHGPGGLYPIVYDLSAEAYGVAWPKSSETVKCVHCGQDTPLDPPRTGLAVLDEIRSRPQGYASKRGSLDAMIAVIQPIASKGTNEWPKLTPAPTATPEERALMGAID